MPVAYPFSLPAQHAPFAGQAGEAPRMLALARKLYAVRRTRRDLFGSRFFTDPAWDMLLDLFIAQHEGKRLSVSAVCIGTGGSPATALRYLSLMQDEGLVTRCRDNTDGRRSYVQLSATGLEAMAELLRRHCLD